MRTKTASTSRAEQKTLLKLSPFELKDKLIELATDFAKFLEKNYECTNILFRLAEKSGVVLMHGGGFGGPAWSVRVSLANLREETYPEISKFLREAAEGYVEE